MPESLISAATFVDDISINENKVDSFIDKHIPPGTRIGTKRFHILQSFCSMHGMSSALGAGLSELGRKANRVDDKESLKQLLLFALWLDAKTKGNVPTPRSLVYLADTPKPIEHITHNLKTNYAFWKRIFGTDIFKEHQTIYKAQLPAPGYFVSVKGGTGSGTFALDIAIGFDGDNPDKKHGGELWRVGFDIEVDAQGEGFFRIVRTGSGQRSANNEALKERNKKIVQGYYEHFTTPPHRLLMFAALEIAYALGFDKVKGLSTEGGDKISTLGNSKSPIDYSAYMSGIGLIPRDGNWFETHTLQEDFYTIIKDYWFTDNRSGTTDVQEYSYILQALNVILGSVDVPHPLQLADNIEDLERAWGAYQDIHERRKERRRTLGKSEY